MKRFGTIIGDAVTLNHVDFRPEGGVSRATSAPVTEVATFYFDSGPPDDAFESCQKFIENCEKETGQAVLGWAYGITHEEIEREGVKGKGAVLLIGWYDIAKAPSQDRDTADVVAIRYTGRVGKITWPSERRMCSSRTFSFCVRRLRRSRCTTLPF